MPHDPKRKETQLSQNDQDLFQEIFWDLFRQNIITLGNRADPNAAYPNYHVSGFGKNLLENEEVYFFHDLSGYEKIIREKIPGIDDLTIFYVKESMQAFLVRRGNNRKETHRFCDSAGDIFSIIERKVFRHKFSED